MADLERFKVIEPEKKKKEPERKKKEPELDYFSDLEIDSSDLHNACDRQPILYMQYGKLAVDKNLEINEQKKVIKVIDAEIKEVSAKLYIKYKQEKIEGKSPTEAQVQSMILIDDEYKEVFRKQIKAIEKLNILTHQYEILSTAVTSFQQRKNMIESKITLETMGIHSTIKQESYKQKIHKKLNKEK